MFLIDFFFIFLGSICHYGHTFWTCTRNTQSRLRLFQSFILCGRDAKFNHDFFIHQFLPESIWPEKGTRENSMIQFHQYLLYFSFR